MAVAPRNWTCRRFSPSAHKTAQLLYHWELAAEDSQEQLMILEATRTPAPQTQTRLHQPDLVQVMAKDFMISSALLQEGTRAVYRSRTVCRGTNCWVTLFAVLLYMFF